MGRDSRELGGAWAKHQRHAFAEPAGALRPWVARFWSVHWDYAEPYAQKVVPYPNVHLTFQGGRAHVSGVATGYGTKVLEGTSHVVGAAFRPGCFRPWLGASVSTLTDRLVPAAGIFGELPEDPGIPALEAFLLGRLPEPDPRAETAAQAVALVAADPGLTRVEALAERLGLSVRGVQRLFAEHVGVGPKWVIRRYRLHEVTERMAARHPLDWAVLAAELGYADQAHLVRDFRSLFGEPPTRYAQRY